MYKYSGSTWNPGPPVWSSLVQGVWTETGVKMDPGPQP